ncbi:MAG: hypothetical protein OXF06_06895 [Bacteroidetes bacterium]|nr:hypothetical protein [Bacteroidota bacterium]
MLAQCDVGYLTYASSQVLNIQIPTAYSRGTGENRQYSEAEDLGHSA